ncbi:MAG: GntR family transcriptional regulator [Zoogloea sp.]|nr:GntR family transcriptional regulator [Zoogloea sp.]
MIDLDELTRPRALYEGIADSLRERIFEHEFAPGTPMDEIALAAAYGVSRTPVREALKVLAHEGLLAMKVRQGCCVTELSRRDIEDLLDVLQRVEACTVRLAARRAGPVGLASLAGATGEDFYRRLIEGCGNPHLENVVEGLVRRLRLGLGPAFMLINNRLFADHAQVIARAVSMADAERVASLAGELGLRRRVMLLEGHAAGNDVRLRRSA